MHKYRKNLINTLLIIYLFYLVSVFPFIYYIIKGNGDALTFIQEVLEIGTYKILIMTLPALANNYEEFCTNNIKRNICLSLIGGLSSALAFAAFSITLRSFLPTLPSDMNRILYIESGYHGTLYLEYPFICTIVFHSSIIGACGILISIINQAVHCLAKCKYVVFPATFLIVQAISVFSTIWMMPDYLRITNIYSGQYNIFATEILNVLWAYAYCFFLAVPFGAILILKRGRNKCIQKENGFYIGRSFG